MIRGILIAILGVAVIGTSYWGYKEHQEKDAVLLHAENNYQRAFHDLAYDMDQLHDKIGTSLAMNSKENLSPELTEVWKLASEAHSSVSQLPLTLMPFNKTEEFLSNIGNFSYQTAVRDLAKEPLNDKEYNTLKQLYSNAQDVQNELRNVQHLVIDNNLRWMDVELALASGEKQGDNTIIDGLKTIEKNADSFAETDTSNDNTTTKQREKGFQHLKGDQISESDAKKIAQKFAPDQNSDFTIAKSGNKTNRDVYSLSMNDEKHGTNIYMDVTQKGGYPVYLIQNREVKDQKLSLNDGSNKALKFLKDNGYEATDFVLDESEQYDNIGIFSYVPVENDVLLYPDTVRMKVALDNGEIVGFSARDFLTNHRKRNLPKPKLSLEEAKKKVSGNVQIQDNRLAIITNQMSDEVLCYEFFGTIDNDTYRMFINANTGIEEKVEKLKNAEPIY
ncbi:MULTISPECIES: germination protein YpeB [Bacillus]|uniref:Sporulation protein n=2 Tax=Bacillus TaxID=1386 RepID=A0A0M3R9H5_9BACI|nr:MULTISPECIES: germination protein YpeB [Bacillus]ALC81436.1 sporulation protein [Bacillus gobiensis]MBP1080471.1 spore germination protein [Bacillus capparidis]MED1094328.1 germination protein YpeB [Bacillus capparidis]